MNEQDCRRPGYGTQVREIRGRPHYPTSDGNQKQKQKKNKQMKTQINSSKSLKTY